MTNRNVTIINFSLGIIKVIAIHGSLLFYAQLMTPFCHELIHYHCTVLILYSDAMKRTLEDDVTHRE